MDKLRTEAMRRHHGEPIGSIETNSACLHEGVIFTNQSFGFGGVAQFTVIAEGHVLGFEVER